MNISLTPELEKFVQEKVESGLYNSASEVIREALRALIIQEKAQYNKAKEGFDYVHHAPNRIWTDEPTYDAQELLKLMLHNYDDNDKPQGLEVIE